MSQGYYNQGPPGAPPGADGATPAMLGAYRLVELLGRGGMGEVWRADHEAPNGFRRRAAVKRILPRFQSDPTLRARFVAEARINARLEHPNIVQVLEYGEQPEPYLALEFVEGTTVARVLKQCAESGQRIPPVAVCYMVAEAAKGLDFAHRKRDEYNQPLGIVHRDVSPQNLLLSVDGAVKVSDFGIARAADNQLRTAAGVQVGKLSYMSPEQVSGQPIDHRADVFALGIVLWETLLVRPLIPRNDPQAGLQMLATGAFEPPSRIDPRFSPVIDQVVMSALAVNPAQRTPTAGDLAAQLSAVVHAISPGFDAAELVRILAALVPSIAWHHPGGEVKPASLLFAPGVAAPPSGMANPSYADGGDGATNMSSGRAVMGAGPGGARPGTMPPPTSGGLAGGAIMGMGGGIVGGAAGGGLMSGGLGPMSAGGVMSGGGGVMGGAPSGPNPNMGPGALPPSAAGAATPFGLGGLPPVARSNDRDTDERKNLPSLDPPKPKPVDPNRVTKLITAGIVTMMLLLAVGALLWLTGGTRDPAARVTGEPVVSITTDEPSATGTTNDGPAAPTQTIVQPGSRVPPGYELRARQAVLAMEPQVQACIRSVRSNTNAVMSATDFDNANGGVVTVTLQFGDAGVGSPELRACIEGVLTRARFTPDPGVTGFTRVLRNWGIRRGGGGGGGGSGGGGGGRPLFPFGNSSR